MIASILKSAGAGGKGESVEGVFMKCVEGAGPLQHRGSTLLEQVGGPLPNLFFRQFLLARRQKPHVPERVFQGA